ncbi:CDP-glycerol glycerophosphotransferase family protein [Isoptericola sp. AK164]|uniref:CDP-glycerol glycerophosphotransferase family protein n=1 Tax=Isoptericola sp. AK164 TaxID=3024246 RepID=UPI0024188805|nr:CDP-glycerol glycerophosphotransferase family protein [Isoptericola sp. AK164]
MDAARQHDVTSGPRRSLTVGLLPDRVRLTFGPESSSRTTAVGTGLRGRPVDRWSPSTGAATGDTVELSLPDLVAAYPDAAVVDLWQQVETPSGEPRVRRLGRFPRTFREVESTECVVDGRSVRLRVNDKGNLVLVLDDAVAPRGFAVDAGTVSHQDATLAVALTVAAFDRELEHVELLVSSRRTAAESGVVLATEPDRSASERRYGAVVHRVEGALDLRDLLSRSGPDETRLDARLVLTDTSGRVQTVRLNERHVAQGTLEPSAVVVDATVLHVVPHFAFLSGGLGLQVDRFTPRAHAALERVVRRPWWTAAARRILGIWLIGEVPYKAQDNGYHFFRWVRTRRPWRLAFYVIDADSPDRSRVEPFGRVVERGSVEHVYLAACASRLVGTHHADYLLPTSDPRMQAAAPGVQVMLRHGVLGMRNMAATYGSSGRVRAADVVHVSSDREKDIVVGDLGYEAHRVRVTGLPRFDALLAPTETRPRGLLVIPTWRSWLGNRRQFDDSEFRVRWQAFFDHPAVRGMIDRGERVSFILHPNMRHFADGFDVTGVEVYRQGERAVQDLMREHAALVTDYSSVAFDFALLERPTFYFQFDRDRFFGSGGSHLDLDAELPGPVLYDEDALASAVATASAEGFPLEPTYRERALRVFPAHDRRSTYRAYRSVRAARRRGR